MSDIRRVLSRDKAGWSANYEILCSDKELEALAREVLSYGNTFQFVARGSSMHPYIQDGDLVSMRSIPAQKVRLGDVLFARTGIDLLVVHRVIRIKEQDGERLFELQGDDCNRSDGFIMERNVLGKVYLVKRGGQIIDSRNPIRKLFSHLQVMLIRWFGKRPVLPKIAQKLFKRLGLI